jgi:hypothetical protein
MTSPLRIAVLAALAAFMMSSAPTSSAPVRPPCEDARDCPVGDRCVKKHFGDKSGFCTGAKKVKVKVKTPTTTPSQSY